MSWEGEFHVRPETATYNKALLRTDLTEEDEPTAALEKAAQDIRDQRDLEDWHGQLRKGTLAMGLVALVVAASPIALVIIWALSQ